MVSHVSRQQTSETVVTFITLGESIIGGLLQFSLIKMPLRKLWQKYQLHGVMLTRKSRVDLTLILEAGLPFSDHHHSELGGCF
jgi:hypothetical protein